MAKEEENRVRFTDQELEKVKKLAVVAHALGLVEKPTIGAIIQLGLNVVWDECHRIYLQARDQKGGMSYYICQEHQKAWPGYKQFEGH